MAARRRAQTHCIHGHEFTERNTRITGRGYRACRACVVDRQRERRKRQRGDIRPEWVTVGKVKVSLATHDTYCQQTYATLRQQLIDAHPDKGGTPAKFIAAQKKLQAFIAEELAWYSAIQMTPPIRVRTQVAA